MTDSSGNKQAVRYQMVPQKLVHLKPDAAAKMAPDHEMLRGGFALGCGRWTFDA